MRVSYVAIYVTKGGMRTRAAPVGATLTYGEASCLVSPMAHHAFLLLLIPAFVALAGGVLAALYHPSPRARGLIQHFAAGVVLAVLAVELLPEIERVPVPPAWIAGAFAIGSLCMYALRKFTESLEAHGAGAARTDLGTGLVLATFIDVAVDGLVIGAGFAVGGDAGLVLAVGLSVELLFLGLALTSDAPGGWRIVLLSGGLGAVVLVFSLLGVVLLTDAPRSVVVAALAFSAAALVYLVTDELLVEAHREPEAPFSTLVLFAGFLAFWAVRLVGGAT